MAKKKLETTGNMFDMCRVYNNIGDIYLKMHEFQKAKENFEKCIEIAEKTKNTRLLGYGLMNAAETCARLGELENAEKYAKEALKIFKKLDEKYMIASYYTIMGIVGVKKKAWDDAEKSFNESISIFEKIKFRIIKQLRILSWERCSDIKVS
jgi:tetratricopeptide (TPR) repeat protein